jgi:RNA polymerase sigma-70 factor (ECF subfamily)
LDTYAELDANGFPEQTMDPLEVIEALEVLIQHLPPRQIIVFLLMEVYRFTAPEVAGMVRMTEGSVYAALHRARAGIRKDSHIIPDPIQPENAKSNAALLDTLLQALRDGDVGSIVGMFEESMHNDANPGFQEFSKRDMLNGSFKHRGPALHVSLEILWGRKVFVVLAETEQGLALHDIRDFEFDDGRIVYHRGYYFCKELLLEEKHLAIRCSCRRLQTSTGARKGNQRRCRDVLFTNVRVSRVGEINSSQGNCQVHSSGYHRPRYRESRVVRGVGARGDR